MLLRNDLPGDPELSIDPALSNRQPDPLHTLFDPDTLDSHTLLLLFLLPESNREDIDPDTRRAVDFLSHVQDRLSRDTAAAPFEQETLAGVIERVSDIRFGNH